MLLTLIAPAFALTCQEVANMVRVGVPDGILIQTTAQFGPVSDGVACLREIGASPEVIAAAEGKVTTPAPTPAQPASEAPPSG